MTKTFLFLIYVAITILFMEFILYHISKKFLLFEVIQNSIDKLDALYNNKVSKINKMYAQYTNNQLNKVDDIYDNLRKREHIEELKLLSKYDDYVN